MAPVDVLSVSGGAGGVAVNVVELDELAAVMRGARRELDLAAAGAARLGVVARSESSGLAPVAAARAAGAADRASAALHAVAAQAGELTDAVLAARALYEHAEGAALRWVRAIAPVLAATPFGLTAAGPGGQARLPRSWGLPGPGPLGPAEALGPLGWALGALPSSTAAASVRVLDADAPAVVPGGVGALMADLERLYPASGGEPGSVEVRRVEAADGSAAWAVLIPGTQSMALGGGNPMDNATNVQAFVGAPSATAAAVVSAMGVAGVRRGEPVLLAGHSQGGLVAMRLAGDPAVRRRYRVTSVVTAGSPVGHVRTPPGVSVLHLEHAGDAVPVLDAAANPDEAGRVTVRRGSGRAGAGPGPAHEAATYAETARMVDASRHPSILAWRAGTAGVFDGVAATRTVVAADRLG